MSTENVPATAGSTEIALPDYLKAMPKVESNDSDSIASASTSIPRISLKAKIFRFNLGGEEIRREKEEMIVTILGVDPGAGLMIKTWFEGAYSNESVPPSCSSQDGIRPDMWASKPQSEMCNTCPQNRFGSATSASGKKTKACRDSKRLWVVDPISEDKPFGVDGTVFGLGVPVTSLKGLSDFGRRIKDLNVPLAAAMVKITMEEDESYPILKFDLHGWLDAAKGKRAMDRNAERNWEGGKRYTETPLLANPTVAPNMALPQAPPASTGKSGNLDEAVKNW